jgi:methionyl-tRNA formyltransferase
LQALIDDGYHIAAVIAHHEEARSRKKRPLEIEAVARAYNIPVLLPERPADLIDDIRAFHADAAVLVAYGKIIPQSVIDVFPKGIINIHPSLLPEYRGPIPIEQAILDGAPETGVSIMRLVKAMDAGPIFAQEKIILTGKESKQELTNELLALGGKLLIQNLAAILEGNLTPTSQDESKATFCQLISKQHSILDFNLPAVLLERTIRAFTTWPQSRAHIRINDIEFDIIITAAEVVERTIPEGIAVIDADQLFIGTAKNALSITALKVPGKNEMPVAAFIRGYVR